MAKKGKAKKHKAKKGPNNIHANQGNFTYDENPMTRKTFEALEWNCDDGHYALYFEDATLTGYQQVDAPKSQQITLTVQTLQPGSYKYLVAVHKGNHIYIDDPTIIIQ